MAKILSVSVFFVIGIFFAFLCLTIHIWCLLAETRWLTFNYPYIAKIDIFPEYDKLGAEDLNLKNQMSMYSFDWWLHNWEYLRFFHGVLFFLVLCVYDFSLYYILHFFLSLILFIIEFFIFCRLLFINYVDIGLYAIRFLPIFLPIDHVNYVIADLKINPIASSCFYKKLYFNIFFVIMCFVQFFFSIILSFLAKREKGKKSKTPILNIENKFLKKQKQKQKQKQFLKKNKKSQI